jgi:hypothetical protein
MEGGEGGSHMYMPERWLLQTEGAVRPKSSELWDCLGYVRSCKGPEAEADGEDGEGMAEHNHSKDSSFYPE